MKDLLDKIFPTLSDYCHLAYHRTTCYGKPYSLSRKEDISENKYQRTRCTHTLMVDHGGHVYRCRIYQL